LILVKFLILGFLTALLFPPFFILPLGFFIFPYFYKQVQLLKLTDSKSFYFFNGTIYSIGFLSVFLIWIKNPFIAIDAPASYTFISFLVVIIISFIFGIFFILLKYSKKIKYELFFFPLFFIIFEMLIANFWYGFPWISFSLIISNNPVGSFFLFLFGTYGTGLLLIFIFFIPVLVKNYKNFFKKYAIVTLFLLVVFILFIIYFIKHNLNDEKKFRNIDIDIIQGNFPILNEKKSLEKRYLEIIENIQNSKAELIVYGENNLPYVVNDVKKITFGNYLKPHQKLVIGGTRFENNNYYNSLFYINKNHIYFFDKQILVPFGEFVPFRDYLNFMDLIVGSSDYDKGSIDRFIKINEKFSFIPVICYEIIFFWKLIDNKNFTSDFIINITNDSWFGDFFGPYQHFYLAKMRAAEFNKPIIRVSNNGISGIFDQNGKILKTTSLNKKEILNFSLKINNKKNLIFYHNLLNQLIIFIFLIFIYLIIKKRWKK